MFVYLFPQNIHSPLAEQLLKLPLPLDITTTLLFVFSLILNQNQENQKNPTVKAKKYLWRWLLKANPFALKKFKKQTNSAWHFVQLLILVSSRCFNSPFRNQCSFILLPSPTFFKEYLSPQVRIKQIATENSV